MRRTRATDNSAVLAAPIDTNTGGYYTAGPPATVFSVDDANIIQEELVALATVKGASLDAAGTTTNQCAQAVSGSVKSIDGTSTNFNSQSNAFTNVLIGTFTASVTSGSLYCSVIGGLRNHINTSSKSSIIGGYDNQIYSMSNPYDFGSNIIVGSRNGEIGGSDYGFMGSSNYSNIDKSSQATILSTNGSIITASTYSAIIADNNSSLIENGAGVAIIGGEYNKISASSGASYSVIAGGQENLIETLDSFIGGGTRNTCSYYYAAVLGGDYNLALGQTSIIIGSSICTASNGCSVISSFTSSAIRNDSVIIGSQYSHIPATASVNNVVMLASRRCSSDLATEEAYMTVGGYSAGTADVAPSWKIESNGGTLHATNTTVQALDYAELFPNLDFIKHPPGRLLTRKGKGAKLAKTGDRVLGVVSVCPNVIGGSDTLGWAGQWEKDEWGATVWEEVEEITEKLGEITSRIVRVRKQNPLYDSSKKHIPRTKRPDEWTVVGLLGQIRVAVDSTVKEDDYVIPSVDGIGTRSDTPGKGRPVECMEIEVPYDSKLGYGIALCLVG